MSVFGIVLFLLIAGMAFWMLLFLLGFIVPFWITIDIFERFQYEIQYFPAHISGYINPKQNIQIVSKRSYLKISFFK